MPSVRGQEFSFGCTGIVRQCDAVLFVDIWDATIKEKARAAMWMSAACMPPAWYIAGMKKKPLTVTEFARMGGKARAQKLSPSDDEKLLRKPARKADGRGKPHLTTRHNQRRTDILGITGLQAFQLVRQ